MPYEPLAVTEDARSRAFNYMWFCAADATACLVWQLVAPQEPVPTLLVGFAVGGPLASAIRGKTDDYMRELCSFGHRLLAGFVAVYAFVASIAALHNPPSAWALWLANPDGLLLALVATEVFYIGYAIAWLRDRF